jgi:hypothetical protein
MRLDKMPAQPKTKAERVREAVEILKQLKEVGITESEPGYKITKEHLDAWIQDGEPRKEKIPFGRAMRVGEMLLPRLEGRAASFVLKATDELREIWKKRGE